jgi:hypothetical protein
VNPRRYATEGGGEVPGRAGAGSHREPTDAHWLSAPIDALRREQVGEAWWELEQVFSDPGCFGTLTAQEGAETMASEFCGRFHDDEVIRRLERFLDLLDAGNVRDAAHQLRFVRRKLQRLGYTPIPSEPIDPAAADEYPAWRARKSRSS